METKQKYTFENSFRGRLLSRLKDFKNRIDGDHPIDSLENGEHADFMDRVDMVDPLACALEDLQELLNDAPTRESRAYLIGVMEMRTRIIFITGKGG